MDVSEFDGWLGKIAVLTPAQRRQAWQTLALSEATDCGDRETGPLLGVDIAGSGPATKPDQQLSSMPSPLAQPLNRLGSDVVAELGQRPWTASVARIATAAMSCIGARRALCRAIVAKPVSGRSTA